MKKLELGQTIAILANVGVIAGIVFLGYEMRQNTTALKSAAGQNINNQIAAIYELRMDPIYMALIRKGDERPTELSPVERDQYLSYNFMILQAWQNIYFQVREGAYDAQLAEGWWQSLRDAFERPGFQESWDGNINLSAEFRQFVKDEVMSRPVTGGGGDR